MVDGREDGFGRYVACGVLIGCVEFRIFRGVYIAFYVQ